MNKVEHDLNEMAWHYSRGDKLEPILQSGAILPTALLVTEGELPIVWFSVAQRWEPTATPLLLCNGKIRKATLQETRQVGGGLIRFGLPKSDLEPWKSLRQVARITEKMVRALRKEGKAQGANPSHWYGSLLAVPVSDCVFQREVSPGVWATCELRLPGELMSHSDPADS